MMGHVPGIRNPIRYDDIQTPWSAPPMLGEHTRQVLRNELEISDAAIDALTASGAAIERPPELVRAAMN